MIRGTLYRRQCLRRYIHMFLVAEMLKLFRVPGSPEFLTPRAFASGNGGPIKQQQPVHPLPLFHVYPSFAPFFDLPPHLLYCASKETSDVLCSVYYSTTDRYCPVTSHIHGSLYSGSSPIWVSSGPIGRSGLMHCKHTCAVCTRLYASYLQLPVSWRSGRPHSACE